MNIEQPGSPGGSRSIRVVRARRECGRRRKLFDGLRVPRQAPVTALLHGHRAWRTWSLLTPCRTRACGSSPRCSVTEGKPRRHIGFLLAHLG